MTAVGLDLGGSKIEAQIFDADWALTDKRRVDTPQNYHALLNAIGIWLHGPKQISPMFRLELAPQGCCRRMGAR